MFDTIGEGRPANRAIVSVKIYFNGTLAISAPGAYVSLPNVPRPFLAGLLKFGSNTIDVVVVKRAQQGELGKCLNGNPPKPLGIVFQVYGDFAADVWIAKNTDAEEIYERAKSSTQQSFIIGARPRNLGPSGIYSGTFILEVTASEVAISPASHPPQVSGQGLRNCKLRAVSSSKARLECEIFRMPAGATPQVQFPAIVTFPSNFSDLSLVFLYREVTIETDDPNLGTNLRRTFLWMCHPETTNPKCPS